MKKILDLGCGNRKYKGAVGVDINHKSDANIIHDLNKFPYPFSDKSYDIVYSSNTIEHLENPLQFLKECKRIAREKVVIITDNQTSLHYIFGNRYKNDPHLFAWNDHSLFRLMKKAGLKNIKIEIDGGYKSTIGNIICIFKIFKPSIIGKGNV